MQYDIWGISEAAEKTRWWALFWLKKLCKKSFLHSDACMMNLAFTSSSYQMIKKFQRRYGVLGCCAILWKWSYQFETCLKWHNSYKMDFYPNQSGENLLNNVKNCSVVVIS